MGYDVTVQINLNKEDTKSALKSFCDSEDLGEVDCAVVCVLSHGKNSNTFITYNGEDMTVGEVIMNVVMSEQYSKLSER